MNDLYLGDVVIKYEYAQGDFEDEVTLEPMDANRMFGELSMDGLDVTGSMVLVFEKVREEEALAVESFVQNIERWDSLIGINAEARITNRHLLIRLWGE